MDRHPDYQVIICPFTTREERRMASQLLSDLAQEGLSFAVAMADGNMVIRLTGGF